MEGYVFPDDLLADGVDVALILIVRLRREGNGAVTG